MSSNGPDNLDSGATWSGPINGSNGSSLSSFHTTPSVESAPLVAPVQPPNFGYDTSGDLLPLQQVHETRIPQDNNVDLWNEPVVRETSFAPATPSRPELLAQVGHYFSLVLAPLLFGGLTCLFVLPLVANGRAKLPPAGLWPLTFVIIAIAIAQGVAVYYAGANNVWWAASTIGAFFLFLLVGCFAIFGLVPGFILLVLFVILFIVLGRLYARLVPEGNVDIVYLFGKYSRTMYPGLNIVLPWEKVYRRLNVVETEWVCPMQRVQMSRTEDVVLRATISYQLLPEDAYLAITQVKNWEEGLHELLIATIQNVATMFTPDDLLAWQRGLRSRPSMNGGLDNNARWEQINSYLFQGVRDKVALWGVQVNWVHVRDVALTPHGAATLDATDPLLNASAPPLVNTDARMKASSTTQPDVQNLKKAQAAGQSMPVSQPAQPVQAVELPKIKDEDLDRVLTNVYREVQGGKLTDPGAIRRIAQQFDAIAKDPEKNSKVNFDAGRAAMNLYAEAERYEMMYATDSPYDDETKPDWNLRRAHDDNMLAGG